MDRFAAVVKKLNADREDRYRAIKAGGGEKAGKAKLTLISELGPTVPNIYRPVLDLTVLDNVAKHWPDQHGQVVYRRLPAKAAQLVVARNKGWKVESTMGATQNRRFGRVPLTRLIELLRYKAEAVGMVVVAPEESYTSKTSFVANEPLSVFDAERKKESKEATTIEAAAQPLPAQADTPKAPRACTKGRRLKGKERNTFVNHQETGRLARVHADVNGAFNILRKTFKGFAYHRGLSLNYQLSRVSARLGLTAIRLTVGGKAPDSGTAGRSNRRMPRNFMFAASAVEL